MYLDSKPVKTNEQYLAELHSNCNLVLHSTPYSYLKILFENKEVNDSYKDEDGDWIHSTKTVIDRKALIKYDEGKYTFLIENWFDDIDNFEIGLYAKVRLGNLYNLIKPTGEYLFPDWHHDIYFQENGLIYCYSEGDAPSSYYSAPNKQTQRNRVCDIYDKRGRLLHANVIVKEGFAYGKSVICKDGLYNYMDDYGALLLTEWLLDARSFAKSSLDLFAFVKTEDGWGVIDANGVFVYSPSFLSIKKADWLTGSSILGITENDNGQNLIMCGGDRTTKKGSIVLGFHKEVEAIVTIGNDHRILAKRDGNWALYEWDYYDCTFKLKSELGDISFVDDQSATNRNVSYRIIQKGGLYNIVADNGFRFEDWFSEIQVFDNLLMVRRDADNSSRDESVSDGNLHGEYEYNLTFGHSFLLDKWEPLISVTPYKGFYLINIKPSFIRNYDGSLYDKSVTFLDEKSEDVSPKTITKIQGCCNILSSQLLFKDWYDEIDFLNSEVFTDGLLKVWKDGKCNLVDKNNDYVSPYWEDDILAHEWKPQSYYSKLIKDSIEVVRSGKKNLLRYGKYLFNPWFTRITDVRNGYYHLHVDGKNGLYSLKDGLVGSRLYDSIEKISDSLFFCRDEDKGLIIDSAGTIVSTAPIAEVRPFREGYAMILTEDLRRHKTDTCQFNFINSDGKIVCPVWFDFDSDHYQGNSYEALYTQRRERPIPQYVIVSKDSKYNLLTPDKRLVFKNWYDSLSGQDGKWLIRDESRGEFQYTFVDNEEHQLTEDWYTDVHTLRNFYEGIYVVERNQEYNVFNSDNEYALAKWTKLRIFDDVRSSMVVVADYVWGNRVNYYLDKKGHLVSKFFGYADCVKRFEARVGDSYQYFLIISLCEPDVDGGNMQILCREDGTPFFKQAIDHFSTATDQRKREMASVFGSIEEFRVPGKGSLLLVDMHWPVKYNDRKQFAIIDFDGNVLTGKYEEYEEISKFKEDGFAVVKRFGLYNVINDEFRPISSLWFDSVGHEYNAKETEYDEYLDDETGMVEGRPYKVERIRRDTSFHDGFLRVEMSGSFNFINQKGEIRYPVWYDSLLYVTKDYFKVSLNGVFNLIDSAGNTISDVWFDRMAVCKRDYSRVIYACKKGELYKLLIIQNSTAHLSDVWVDKVARYDKSDGYYSVRLRDKKNFINDEGQLVLPGWYDDLLLSRVYNGFYVVVNENDVFNIYSSYKSKMLSDKGFENVICDKGSLFSYGWCGVKIDGKYTFVSIEGEFADGYYDSLRAFRNGFAGVVLDGKKNYLTSGGHLLSSTWFEEISPFTSRPNRAIVKFNGKLNIIDSSGTFLLPENIQSVKAIELCGPDYCRLSIDVGDGKTASKFFDYQSSHLHESEWEVKSYLESINADVHGNGERSGNNSGNDNLERAIMKGPISRLFEDGAILGINYTLVRFGNKSNLIDKNGLLLYEEWVDSSSILMSQGVPFIKTTDNKWVLVK